MPAEVKKRFSPVAWKVLVAVAVAAAATVWRVVNAEYSIAPNVEFVTAAAVIVAYLWHHPLTVLAPVVLVATTDLALGISPITAFTWTAWFGAGALYLVIQRMSGRLGARIAVGSMLGVSSSVGFYLWTNFGVWQLGRGTYYPPGIDGLIESYVAGLPFLRNMVLGNLIFVPMALLVVVAVERAHRSAMVTRSDQRSNSQPQVRIPLRVRNGIREAVSTT